jgi:phospholipase/carboxylesterase
VSLDLLAYRSRAANGDPDAALVLMHGRGADELDLAPVAEALDPDRRLAVYLPRGPLSLPPGGAHWYVLRQVGAPDPPTFRETFERLTRWVDAALADAGLGHERLVLSGFSQGSVMAYSLGLAASRPRPAAILAFSGFIPHVPDFEWDLESRAGLPVSISHGTLDGVIPVDFGRDAQARLEAAALDVRYVEEPIGHSIGPRGLAQAEAVLAEAIDRPDQQA